MTDRDPVETLAEALAVFTNEMPAPQSRHRALAAAILEATRATSADDPAHPHLIGGEFQSDKYPTCPRGKVPLSCKDPTAQDLLWVHAQRRRSVDAEFATDLETALRNAGYVPVLERPEQKTSGSADGAANAPEDAQTTSRPAECREEPGTDDHVCEACGDSVARGMGYSRQEDNVGRFDPPATLCGPCSGLTFPSSLWRSVNDRIRATRAARAEPSGAIAEGARLCTICDKPRNKHGENLSCPVSFSTAHSGSLTEKLRTAEQMIELERDRWQELEKALELAYGERDVAHLERDQAVARVGELTGVVRAWMPIVAAHAHGYTMHIKYWPAEVAKALGKADEHGG